MTVTVSPIEPTVSVTSSSSSVSVSSVTLVPEVKTYQFEIDNFKKGNTAPANVYVGSAPVVNGAKFSTTNQRLGLTFMIPLDWDVTTDMQFMAMCAIPEGGTFTVGDRIDLRLESRVTRSFGDTKLDDAGFVNDTHSSIGNSPAYGFTNDSTILAGKNTEFYTYMPSISIPASDLGGVGGVYYGSLGLGDITGAHVPEIVVYQMHMNYFGKSFA